MKILLVTFYFPPFNTVAARRTGKFAYHLQKLGHDVRVLTARDQNFIRDLNSEGDEIIVHYTKWRNFDKIVQMFLGAPDKVAEEAYSSTSKLSACVKILGRLYKALLHIPDAQIGWYPFAVSEGTKIIKNWRPDVIYASANPYTSLLVANRLASKNSIPFIAEFRDLWIDNPYLELPGFRRSLDKYLEKKVLSNALACVTVSEPLKQLLSRKFDINKICVVQNGVDLDDDIDLSVNKTESDTLNLVHTGMIYPGKRDPSALFRAASNLIQDGMNIRIIFVGKYTKTLLKLVEKFKLRQHVSLGGMVSAKESMKFQNAADVNVLLLWNNENESGSFTGKFFEYLRAGKPILVIGPEQNVASQVVIREKIGIVSNDEVEIKNFLEKIYQQKVRGEEVQGISEIVKKRYSREKSAKKLSDFIKKSVNSIQS